MAHRSAGRKAHAPWPGARRGRRQRERSRRLGPLVPAPCPPTTCQLILQEEERCHGDARHPSQLQGGDGEGACQGPGGWASCVRATVLTVYRAFHSQFPKFGIGDRQPTAWTPTANCHCWSNVRKMLFMGGLCEWIRQGLQLAPAPTHTLRSSGLPSSKPYRTIVHCGRGEGLSLYFMEARVPPPAAPGLLATTAWGGDG